MITHSDEFSQCISPEDELKEGGGASKGETLMLGKIEDKKKGATEDEMVGWRHRLHGPEFEQTPGGRGSLVCCSSRGLLATEQQQALLIWLMSSHW